MNTSTNQTYRVTGEGTARPTTVKTAAAVKSRSRSDTDPLEDLVACAAICPYYQRDRGRGRVYCECAHFRFPDKESRREIVYALCAHPDGYKTCPMKQAMDHFYERKYRSIEA